MKFFIALLSMILIPACAMVGPDYEGAPEVDLPESWNHKLGEQFVAGEINLASWWANLDDQTLD